LTIAAKLADGLQYRHLPICNTSGRPYYRISIRKGEEVHDWIYNQKEGAELDLLAPAGQFHLQGNFNDVCLIGSGMANLQLFQIANSAKERNVSYIQICPN